MKTRTLEMVETGTWAAIGTLLFLAMAAALLLG
jgi:hypothetical protein